LGLEEAVVRDACRGRLPGQVHGPTMRLIFKNPGRWGKGREVIGVAANRVKGSAPIILLSRKWC
jgi:hypothetical protein